jgi:hypothetical protein
LPRCPRHKALILSIEKIHPWQESDAEVLESISSWATSTAISAAL